MPNEPLGISLSAFNARIEKAISIDSTLQSQWVIAEAVDIRLSRGHCYMELIEKDANGTTIAKISAAIWANNYSRLYYKFLNATGQPFGNSMKLLLKVTATFHIQYGIKAVISDINPEFTLGDLARQRQEIIKRLTDEGFLNEQRFAHAFVNDKFKFNGWGRVKIAYQLRSKGISQDCIDEALTLIDDDTYEHALVQLLSAKARTLHGKQPQQARAALLRFATARGFEPALCYRITSTLINAGNDFD